ncbi:MAG: hypothetical protein JEZ10_01920 [Verrucomicrobia bacterium]|nr:hypothetical protein [Verrucomicrobiota bacterium]
MRIQAFAVLIALSTCLSAFSDPYTYRVLEKQDISYGATKRMVYRIYLNTETNPDQTRMEETAKQIWTTGNQKWNEFTVFMIFGEIKNFNSGAYGIAEFSPLGRTSFQINDVPLKMLELQNGN